VLQRPCNWMQGLEGEMDTVHATFLHNGMYSYDEYEPGSFAYYQYKTRPARFSTVETEFGLTSGAFRPAEEDTYYWRVTHILFPFYNMIPNGKLGEGIRIGAYVPMDDEHTLQWEISVWPEGDSKTRAPSAWGRTASNQAFLKDAHPIPNDTSWFGRFRVEEQLSNDYFIDRDLQRSNKGPGGYTGIKNPRIQDAAVTETMGPIYDRSNEHLGTTDQFIIAARRRFIRLARALEQGITPPGVDEPEVYRQRSGQMILPRNEDFWQAYLNFRSQMTPLETMVEALAR
jgi:phthalate 4,5-dioxygenase oxygenase subunit